MRVGVENVLHVEVGRRVNSVQQCPLVAKRQILVLEFALDGAEALYHDALTWFDAALLTIFITVVAAGRNEGVVPSVRLRVADDENGKHVDVLRVQFA